MDNIVLSYLDYLDSLGMYVESMIPLHVYVLNCDGVELQPPFVRIGLVCLIFSSLEL